MARSLLGRKLWLAPKWTPLPFPVAQMLASIHLANPSSLGPSEWPGKRGSGIIVPVAGLEKGFIEAEGFSKASQLLGQSWDWIQGF